MYLDLVDSLMSPGHAGSSPVLSLFGGLMVSVDGGHRIAVPEGSKRLLVFVALHRGQVERRYAAGALWPIGDDERAAGNLRSALWRLNRARIDVLVADKRSLSLRPDVVIDLRVVSEWATRLIAGQPTTADLAVLPAGIDALDLLPGWYDDWVLLERERVRQRLLHALEALSLEHLRASRWALAVEVAMLAVNAEPLRESAQRALLMAHLGEGNWAEAMRAYDTYRCLLRRELDVEPRAELATLLEVPGARRNQPRFGTSRMPAAAPGAGSMALAT
jgi:DNA-binding SARP family transcriptional activator